MSQFENQSENTGDALLQPETAVADTGVKAGSPTATKNGVEDSESPAEQRVPYERFSKVTEENKRLKAELEATKKARESGQLSELIAALEAKEEAGATSLTKAQLAVVRRAALAEFVEDRMPDLNSKQAREVASILADLGSKGFTVEDAVAVAARRRPELFARQKGQEQTEDEGPSAGAFSANRPGGGPQQTKSIDREIEETIAALDSEPNSAMRIRLQARVNLLRDRKAAAQSRRR